MRKLWIQIATGVLCGISASAAPTTQPAKTVPSTMKVGTPKGASTASTKPAVAPPASQPVVVKHEPVAPPPPPAPIPAPVVDPVATTHPPTTQPSNTPAPVVTPARIAPATQPGPIDDRVAYAIGLSAGRRIADRLSEDGRSADELLVIKGVIDGLSNRDPAYPRAEVLEALAEFQAYTQQRRAEKLYADNPSFRKNADDNLQKSRALLDQNAEMAGVEVQPDGVQILALTPGTARMVGNAHVLTLKNLRVALADGTLVQETSADKTEKIEAGDVLPALMDAIRGVRVGGKYRIWLPPDKAYGLAGKPPVIGPNQAIEYEFELLNAE
jgi:FKBP-type peptidyl-prolyl cis-trans isomerase